MYNASVTDAHTSCTKQAPIQIISLSMICTSLLPTSTSIWSQQALSLRAVLCCPTPIGLRFQTHMPQAKRAKKGESEAGESQSADGDTWIGVNRGQRCEFKACAQVGRVRWTLLRIDHVSST